VFISYATADRGEALLIREHLVEMGVVPFLDAVDLEPGADVVMGINDALERADFYVLLWSAAARGRYWVNSEISAALVQERRLARPFVFVVRLDDSELPAMLAPRRYLDTAGAMHKAVAAQLASVWLRDRAVGVEVMIAPEQSSTPIVDQDRAFVYVYARNRALSVAHEFAVPLPATARGVVRLLTERLSLPAEASEYGGAVGVRFGYRYWHAHATVDPESDEPLSLGEGDIIDIEITVTPFGPAGALGKPVSFLPGRDGELSSALVRALCRKAFAHLLPVRRR